jgi:hypothetical protein
MVGDDSGCISAIFRLIATEAYLESDDSTYAVSPVAFWALSEMTSVFLVYSMPAVPAAVSGTMTSMKTYYSRFTGTYSSTRRTADAGASTGATWQYSATGTSSRYRNIDKDGHLLSSIDVKGSRWDTSSGDQSRDSPQSAVDIVRTVEVRTEPNPALSRGNDGGKLGDPVLRSQHPW